MSNCKKCNCSPCGCSDRPLTTVTNTSDCPTCNQGCDQYLNTSCIIYDGPAIADSNILPGMNMNQIIQAMFLFDTDNPCITGPCHSPFVEVGQVGSTTIQMNWAAVSEASSYIVEVLDTTTSPPSWIQYPAGGATTYTITGLLCGTTYTIRVKAVFSTSDCNSVEVIVTTLNC